MIVQKGISAYAAIAAAHADYEYDERAVSGYDERDDEDAEDFTREHEKFLAQQVYQQMNFKPRIFYTLYPLTGSDLSLDELFKINISFNSLINRCYLQDDQCVHERPKILSVVERHGKSGGDHDGRRRHLHVLVSCDDAQRYSKFFDHIAKSKLEQFKFGRVKFSVKRKRVYYLNGVIKYMAKNATQKKMDCDDFADHPSTDRRFRRSGKGMSQIFTHRKYALATKVVLRRQILIKREVSTVL